MEADGAYMDHLVIANPRRANFPIHGPNAAEEQINWEFYGLEHMHIFSMYFSAGESDQPICMYELGRNIIGMQWEYGATWANRIVINVEDGYRRQQDVNIQTKLATGEDMVINNSRPRIHAAAILSAYTWIEENT